MTPHMSSVLCQGRRWTVGSPKPAPQPLWGPAGLWVGSLCLLAKSEHTE